LVITANDNLVDGGWSCDPERSGSRCHMARETGVKAGNEEQGIGIKTLNFKRNPENKEYVMFVEPPPWMVIHTTSHISQKTIQRPALPLSSYPIGCLSGLSPTAFYSTLRDRTQSKEFLLLLSLSLSLSFAFYYFCHLSILLHPHSLSDFTWLFAGFVLYHFQSHLSSN
jgi:hypothetical protein